MIADPGSYAHTGQDAGGTLILSVVQGSYAHTGQNATFAIFGSYLHTGQSSSYQVTWTTDSNSYLQSGQPVEFQPQLTSNDGSYSHAGEDSSYQVTWNLEGGQYQTLDQSNMLDIEMEADGGSYDHTGGDATMVVIPTYYTIGSDGFYTIRLDASPGEYNHYGVTNEIFHASGSYSHTGFDADLYVVRLLSAERGSYVHTGFNIRDPVSPQTINAPSIVSSSVVPAVAAFKAVEKPIDKAIDYNKFRNKRRKYQTTSGDVLNYKRRFAYSDISLLNTVHPNTGDVTKVYDVNAIRQSIKNLLLTNKYERLFQPELAGNLSSMLFELDSNEQRNIIESTAIYVIDNYEPRASIEFVDVKQVGDHALEVTIEFTPINQGTTQTVNIFLEQVR